MTASPLPTLSTRRLRAWAFLRRELVYINWALMEVVLIVPIAMAFMTWAIWSPASMVPILLLLMFFPFSLARLLKWLDVSSDRQQRIMVGTAVLAMVLAVRVVVYDLPSPFSLAWVGIFFRNVAEAGNDQWQRDFHTAFLTGVIWWRGLALVGRELDVRLLGIRLQRGALIVAPFTALLGYWRLSWQVTPYILLYFLLALTAVFLTRAEQTEREHHAIYSSYTPGLLARILITGGTLVAVPGVLALFLAEGGRQASGWLAAPYQAARFAFAVTGITIAKLAAPVTALFDAIARGWAAFLRRAWELLLVEYTPAEPSDFSAPVNEDLIESLTRPTGEALINPRLFVYIFIALALLIVVVIIWYAFRGSAVAGGNGRITRVVDSLVSRVVGLPRAQKQRQQREAWLRNWRMALSIRRIYKRLIYEAEQLGYPRDDSDTPYEFLPILYDLWPQQRQDVELITQAYVRVRYGEVPESLDELHQIEAAWDRIEAAKPAETAVARPAP